MKHKQILILIILEFFCAVSCFGAPIKHHNGRNISRDSFIVASYIDSLKACKVHMDSLMYAADTLDDDAGSDARFFRVFAPLTFYYSVAGHTFSINDKYKGVDDVSSAIDDALMSVYVNHPEYVVNTESDLSKIGSLHEEITSPIRHKVDYSREEASAPDVSLDTPVEIVIEKPNFWTFGGDYYLQFLQNYVSSNWYKGGESTNALLSGLVLEANFDDRQRIEFENKLEIKLGFVTAPSDTVHKYKTNADLLRLSSKLGVKAFKNWYYTLAGEFKTQFFGNYKTNTNDMISNFLSPAQLDITLGMDFKQNKKNYSLSLLGSPLAYTFMYISNDKITDPGAFNVDPGHKTANLFGSKFTGNLTWTIIPSIVWESKLEYFTTYDTVIASWENTFNFVLNRYLSTKLFVHARYDDGVTLTEDNKSYFQLQELLSFGLNYTW